MGGCSVIGSCAFLAAATHGPLSALVLVLELTRHIDATMVPMLLAVAGAVFVVRRIEIRSVYSVRIHLEPTTQRAGSLPSHIISEGYNVVTAATGYAEIVDQFLNNLDKQNQPLYVIDNNHQLIGCITRGSMSAIRSIPIPLEAVKAVDMLVQDNHLISTMTRQQMADALQRSNSSTLPVVDPATGRLIGVFRG